MDNRNSIKEKILNYCLLSMFVVYIIFLLRITLFKQAPIYNLFAAIGASERIISIIPLQSIIVMIKDNISIMRILENVLGNITIFIPFGLLLPIIFRKENKTIILYGASFSIFIEIIQFIFGMGSTDIDDLIFNTLGFIIGYLLFRVIKKKSKSNLSFLTIMTAIVLVIGGIAFGFLLVNNTDLFIISPRENIVENGELVQDFIETPSYFRGKIIGLEDSILTVEKNVKNASEQRKLMDFEITTDTRIYVRHCKIEYFFSTISSEYQRYEGIEKTDFVSQMHEGIIENNSVLIWSSNGKIIDKLVVVKLIE